AGPEAVAYGRRDVVPEAAVLVVGHNHQHLRPPRAPLESLQDLPRVPVARDEVAPARMLVDAAPGLVESDGRQGAAVDVTGEVREVLEVRRAIRGPPLEPGEEREWLVVEAEAALLQRPRLRLAPAARVPGPPDAILAEPVADRRQLLDGQEVGAVEGQVVRSA